MKQTINPKTGMPYWGPVKNALQEAPKGKKLSESAMLARVVVRGWTGRIVDTTISREIARAKNATMRGDIRDVGQYQKALVSRRTLRRIINLGNNIRQAHYSFTMPWDDGVRILPVGLHKRYETKLDGLIAERESATISLTSHWDAVVEDARDRLGDMFRATEFPSAEAIANKIEASYSFSMVPDVDHFVVNGLVEEKYQNIRDGMATDIAERMRGAVDELYVRLLDAVNACSERLDADDDGEPKIFRDTILTNLKGIAEIMPDLNITGDETLASAGENVMTLLENVEPNELRSTHKSFDPKKHQTVKDAMDDMATTLSGYFGEGSQS